MTHKEWHVGFDTLLRRVNTSRKGFIVDEVKDTIINHAILNVVGSRISRQGNRRQEGIADTVKRLDDIRELIVPNLVLDCYPTFINPTEEANAFLPYDYWHIVSSRSKLEYDCEGVSLLIGSDISNKYMIVPFPDDIAPAPKYAALSFEINGVEVFGATATAGYNLPDIIDTASKFMGVNAILQTLNNSTTGLTGASIYWERYGDIFESNSFILIFNAASTTITSAQVKYTRSSTSAYPIITDLVRYIYTTAFGTTIVKPNRLKGNEVLDEALAHYFDRTKFSSPITNITGNTISVFNDATFRVQSIILTYVKKPILLNVHIGTSPEITNDALINEILEVAVNIANAYLASGNLNFSTAISNEPIK